MKRAYYTVCQPCATAAEVCAKCNVKQTVVIEWVMCFNVMLQIENVPPVAVFNKDFIFLTLYVAVE